MKVYEKLISESAFKNKKWHFDKTLKDIQIFENYTHLRERLKIRYSKDISDWIYWSILKTQIINKFLELGSWSKCSKKNPYQRGFTISLTFSKIWLSGILQNDLEDKVKRIYFSTFLPEKPTFNKNDIYLELPL